MNLRGLGGVVGFGGILTFSVAAVVFASVRIDASTPARLPTTPVFRAGRPTTDARLALANLEGSIESLHQRSKAGRADSSKRAELAELLLMRAQFLGRVSDLEYAAEIAQSIARDEPRNPRALLLRGRSFAALHLFDRALADFEAAERLGADEGSVLGARAAVLSALGRSSEAIEIRTRLAREKADVLSLGALAVATGEGGDLEAARIHFQRAQSVYRDVSPFPLAWIYFQEGKLSFDEGDLPRARLLFAAAVDHAPFYLAAAGHLGEVEAALGNTQEAIRQLRAVATIAEDPDSEGQLCRVLRDAGASAEAESCRERVARRYEKVLESHPEAFWDHAAEFFLAMGEPRRALGFARSNVELRPSVAALELAIRAALASDEGEAACVFARRAVTLHPGIATGSLAASTLASCATRPRRKG